MKKLILICSICTITFLANAQQDKTVTNFENYSNTIDNYVNNAWKVKNYQAAADSINLWLTRYNALDPKTKKYIRAYSVNMYYNLACFYSLKGNISAADEQLEKAIDAGYIDYAHIIVDSDLTNLHNDARYKADVQKIREKGDFGYILQKSGPYNHENANIPAFTYQSATDSNLVALKNKFNLDSVAGNGDEISKLKRILYWAHNSVRHDGNSSNPLSRNAIDLIAVCKKENRGVNCRMMSTILRDAYQAEGFDTRIVTCMPKDTADNDCHVITVVWSKTLNKWIWMDPTFNAYVTDDKGNLLNIEEVRQRLINGDPLVLNDDANWNNEAKETKEFYLGYYMSKNLYWLKCSAKSEWNIETYYKGKAPIDYINLYPGTYSTIHAAKVSNSWQTQYATNNPDDFWAAPQDARP
jgi:hypothetical protein